MRMSWALLFALTSGLALAQTMTPFQRETGHNTAACSNDNTQSYCPLGGFPVGEGPWVGGWADNRMSILTRVIHPGVGDYGNKKHYPGNVSKGRGAPPWPDAEHPGDIHNLLYAGNTTKVFAVVQHWFSTSPLAKPQKVSDPPPLGAPKGYTQVVDVGRGYAGQKVTGYSVNDCAYIDAMVDDLWERGFDGIIGFAAEGSFTCAQVPLSSGRYHGQKDNFTASCGTTSAQWWVDHGLQKLQKSMLRYPEMQYAMMFAGGFTNRVTCGCKNKECDYISKSDVVDPPSDYYQAQCIRDQIQSQLTYYAKGSKNVPEPCASGPEKPAPGYFQRPNYLTPSPNRPVVQLFFDAPKLLRQCSAQHPCIVDVEANVKCTSQEECWQKIWSDVKEHSARELGVQPYFIDKSGPQTADGAYMWTRPLRYYPPGTHGMTTEESIRRQLDWGGAGAEKEYTEWAQSPKGAGLYFGAAWKGVDDRFWNNAATIDQGLVTSQRCGQTWLETFAAPGKYFKAGRQLPYMIVPTYDDHEAGTAFQNGIDNCASVHASLRGTKLTWSTVFDDPHSSPKTLDHYRLLDSPDGIEVKVVKDRIPPSLEGSLDISTLHLEPGPHVLYLKLIAKPGLLNKLSQPMPVTLPLE
jgi:hypothetical protein